MTKIIFATVVIVMAFSLSGCYTQLATTKPESRDAYNSQSSSQTYSDAAYVGSDTLQQGGSMTINNYYEVPRYSRFIYPYRFNSYYDDLYYDPFYGPAFSVGFGWGYPYPYSYYRPWYGGYYPMHYYPCYSPAVAYYNGFYGPRGSGQFRTRGDGFSLHPAVYPTASTLSPATQIRTRNDSPRNGVAPPNANGQRPTQQRPSGRGRSGGGNNARSSRADGAGATRGSNGGGRRVESRPAPSGGGNRQSESHGEGGRGGRTR